MRRMQRLGSRRATRRRLFLEALEGRRLLVATDLASISGLVFDDFSGNGYDPGEEVAGAELDLYRDNGDGVFNQSTDTLETTTNTDTSGEYLFSRLTEGGYFVLQDEQTVDGSNLQRQVSPLIQVTSTAVEGRIVMVIDDFDQTHQIAQDTTDDGVPVTSSVAAPEAIGGSRDLFANKTSVNGAVQISVDDPLLPNLLSFDSIATGQGERRVTWDGPDNDATRVTDTGLGEVDLTSDEDAFGLQLQIGADLPGGDAVVRVYSDDGNASTANRFSTAVLSIPQTGGTVPFLAEFIPFSEFTATSGGGADLTNIGAIELEITGAANVNGSAQLVGTVGETMFIQDFANFAEADLRLAKTIDDATPNVGQNVNFTITLDNDGPDTATGVAVTDQLPTGVTFVSSGPSQGSYDNTTGIWSVGTIASNGTATLRLTGSIASAGERVNTAEVTASDQFDPDSTPGNGDPNEDDQDSVSFVTELIDLSLVKTAVPSTVVVGSEVTFTVTLDNEGPSTATGVVVEDRLPSGISFVRSSASQGNYDSSTALWTVGTIAPGANPTLTIIGTVDVAGPKTNTAQVFAADQEDIDSTPGNNDPNEDDQDSATIEAPQIDLSLTKDATPSSVIVGETVSFTINLANAGPSTATGVTVLDQLPAGVSYVESSATQGSYSPGTGIWTVGEIAPGSLPRLTLVGRVDVAGDKTNTAEVATADQPDIDSTPGNNNPDEDDQDSVTIMAPQIDLSLTKTAVPTTVVVGENVTFNINLANAGPSVATGVVVEDRLPSGISFQSAQVSQGTYDAQTGFWTVGTVSAGQTPTLSIIGRVDTPGSKTNTAQVWAADQPDIDSTPGNNNPDEDDQDSATIEAPLIDLSLTKSVDDATPDVGENVTFTIIVSNAGPDVATGVLVEDRLPAGLNFVTSSTLNGSFNPGTGIWDIGSVAAGANATLTIEVTPTTTLTLTNVAEVIAADQPDADSTPGNNDPTEDDQDSADVSAQQIDLSLIKTVNDSTPNVGDVIEFQILVTNDGPSTAQGVVVEDVLPTGLTFDSFAATIGGYNTSNGQWTIGSMAANTDQTLTLRARVDIADQFVNTAEVIEATPVDVDSTPGNGDPTEDDQDSAIVSVQSADLSLTKTVNNATANVGENVSFTITVQNSGPDAATGVEVRDLLPSGITFDSSQPSQGTYDAATGIWQVNSVPSGGSATLQIVGLINSPGDKTNTAEVTASDQFDPDSTPGNNNPDEDDQDSVIVSPPVIDLSLIKDIDIERPIVGETIRYTITVDNEGPDDASGVVVEDELPDGVIFVGSSTVSGNYNPSTGLWNIGGVRADSSVVLFIDARVDTTAMTTNVAEVFEADQYDIDSTPGNGDPNEDDYDTATFMPAVADLSLSKEVDITEPNVGEDVTFTIVVSNSGPDPATGVSVLDELPDGLDYVSDSPEVGNYNRATGIWDIGDLDANETVTLLLVATSDAPGEVLNTAQVETSDQLDPDSTPGNDDPDEDDQDSALVVGQQIDLELSKTVDDQAPNVGDEIQFTILLDNQGPSTATGVEVRDLLPDGLTFQSSRTSQGGYDVNTGVWTVGTLGEDGSATLDLFVSVDEILDVENVAEVIAADQPDVDSTPDNGDPTEDDQDSVNVTTQVADLSLTKTANNERPNVGEEAVFVINLRNDGPDTATSIRVSDPIPDGLSFVSSDSSQGSYDRQTGVWTVGELASRANATLELRAEVIATGEITNTAEVLSVDQADPDSTPGNGVESEDDQDSSTVFVPVIDLEVTKSADPFRPSVGGELVYTVTLRNEGPDDATGIVVEDRLPAGVTFNSASPSTGRFDDTTGAWSINSLSAGSSATLILRTTVDEPGEPENVIEVIAADQFDSDSTPGNNVPSEDDQDSISVTTASADLSLIKTVDNDRPGVGSNVFFTIQVLNAGPDSARDVEVRDQLPPGFTFIRSNATGGDYNPSSGIWDIPLVSEGIREVLIIEARVDDFGERINTAEIIASSEYDPNSTPGNNDPTEDDQDSVTLVPELVDLALTKVVDDNAPDVGETIEFMLELSNEGPSNATGVLVTDELPDGLSVTGINATQGVYDPVSGIWNVGEVSVGSTPQLRISATVDTAFPKINIAEVSAADQPDIDSTPGNGDPDEDDIGIAAVRPSVIDLELDKTVNDSEPNQAEELIFTVSLRNEGRSDATGVVVREILPEGLDFVRATETAGDYSPFTGLWSVPMVSAGGVETLQLVARLESKTEITNVAEVIAADQFDIDSTPDNQDPTEDDIAFVSVTPKLIDVSVSAEISDDKPGLLEEFQMVFRVTNDGPEDATGVSARLMIPSDIEVISTRPSRGTYIAGLWTINNLAVGETVDLVVTGRGLTRGTKEVDFEVIAHDQADVDSDPGNHVPTEDDQTVLYVKVPLFSKRLFLAS